MQKNSKTAFSLIELSIVILIIGILVAGVTQSSRLVSEMRLKTAQSQTQSSPVNSISGILTWLEATSDKSFADTEEENGLTISTWYDINNTSVYKSNATNASGTASDHPTYKTNCIGGLPCVAFNGTSQYLDLAISNTGVIPEITFFIVFSSSANEASDAHSILGVSGSWSANSNFQFKRSTNLFFQLPSTSYDTYSAAISANKNYVAAVVDAYTSATIYLNGVAGTSSTISSGNLMINPSSMGIAHWNRGASRDNWFGGNIGEIIIYGRALKTEERQSIEKYLGKKWGISIS